MSTIIVDNFQLNKSNPIDNRFVVGTGQYFTSRNDITYKYPGLRVYDLSDSKFYYWDGSSFIDESLGGGGGGGGTGDVTSSGSGIPSYIPRYTGGNTITVSQIFDNTFNVGFGTRTFGSEKYNFFGGDVKIESGVPGNTAQLRVDDGTRAKPTYTFDSNSDTGIYYDPTQKSVSTSVTGVNIQDISLLGVSVKNGVMKLTDGTSISPSYTFNNYNTSGMYYDVSKSSVSFSLNSVEQMHILNNVVLVGSQTPGGERLSIQSNSNNDASDALRIYSSNLTQDAQYAWGGIISSSYFKILSGTANSVFINGFEVTNGSDVLAKIHQKGINGLGYSGNLPSPWESPSISSGILYPQPTHSPGLVATVISGVSFISPFPAMWSRVGNVVTMSGMINLTIPAYSPTSGNCEFLLTLPIPTEFGQYNYWQLSGVGKVVQNVNPGFTILEDHTSGGDVISIHASGGTTIGPTPHWNKAHFKFWPRNGGGAQINFPRTVAIVYTLQYIVGSYPNELVNIPPSPASSPPPPTP